MDNRFLFPRIGFLFLFSFACVSCAQQEAGKSKELASCEEAQKTAVAELEICQQKTAADLAIVARNLEAMLQEPAPPASPEAGVPVTVILPPPKLDESIQKIQQLTPLIITRFNDLQKLIDKRFEAQKRDEDVRDRKIEDKLESLQEQTLDQGVTSAQLEELQILVETLKSDRLRGAQRISKRLVEVEQSIGLFDSEKLNCPGCGRGFTDKFARELLTFHNELMRELQDVASEARREPD